MHRTTVVVQTEYRTGTVWAAGKKMAISATNAPAGAVEGPRGWKQLDLIAEIIGADNSQVACGNNGQNSFREMMHRQLTCTREAASARWKWGDKVRKSRDDALARDALIDEGTGSTKLDGNR